MSPFPVGPWSYTFRQEDGRFVLWNIGVYAGDFPDYDGMLAYLKERGFDARRLPLPAGRSILPR